MGPGGGFPRRVLAATLFRATQLALLPFAAVVYVGWIVRLVAVSRRTRGSATALASLYARYMQHRLGTRVDGLAARLLLLSPLVPELALRMTTAPTLVAHRLTGYVPRIYRYPYQGEPPMLHQASARTAFFDAALARHLPGIAQLVILGAGFDTRAYRLPAGSGLHSFEVDTPGTQALKREMLARAGADTTAVTYVPANLMTEDWLAELVAAGFRSDLPTFFLMESVMMYLDRKTVEDTLHRIAGMAPGSVVAFDYISAGLLHGGSLFMRYGKAMAGKVGERWLSALDNTPPARERIAAFLASFGLELEEHRTFGRETERKPAPAGFAVARVP